MRFLGIDPDTKGAWAVVDEAGRLWDVTDAPVAVKGSRRRLLEQSIVGALNHGHVLDPVTLALLEATPALPASMGGLFANHQRGAGGATYRTACAALGIPYEEVQAAVWKRSLGLLKASHDQLRARAAALWPTWAGSFAKKKDHGRACAALLAEAARRRWQGKQG